MKFRLLIIMSLVSAIIGIVTKCELLMHIGTGFAAVAAVDAIHSYFKEVKDEA